MLPKITFGERLRCLKVTLRRLEAVRLSIAARASAFFPSGMRDTTISPRKNVLGIYDHTSAVRAATHCSVRVAAGTYPGLTGANSMRRLSLISVSVAVVACVATLAPVLTSLYVANRDAARREQSDLQGYAEKAVLRSELVTRQAFAAIAEMAAVSQQPCSPAFLRQLARISFTYRYVEDSGVYGSGEYRCSPLLGDVRHKHFKLPPPDWQSKDGYLVWFHQKSPLDVTREDLMIGHNGDYVSIDPQSYVDFVDAGRRPVAAINVEKEVIFALSPGADSAEMLDAWKRHGKVASRDWLYAVALSPTRELGVVVKSPRVGLLAGWANLFAAWLFLGVLAGALVGWMAFRVLSRQLSFPALLERAIKRGSIDVYYQPIVRLADRECVGAEALVRRLVDGRYISPEIF